MLSRKIQILLDGKGSNYIFPFFWQHGEEEAVLRKYMEVIHNANIGAVCVESRPHPDFCGDKWWQDMDIILDEARKRNMKVWILDDSHFPTGFANGAMENQPDELCRQSLCCKTVTAPGGEPLHLEGEQLMKPAPFEKSMVEQHIMTGPQREFADDRLLAVCAWESSSGELIDLMPFVSGEQLDWTAPSGEWTVYLLHLSRNYGYHRSYINMMDKRSCRVLLDAVYEPHYAHYKADFGTTIAGFFSDEPELGNGHLYEMNDPYGGPQDYPWSRELETELQKTLGKDYAARLALLWIPNTGAEAAQLRCTFMDAVTRLVQQDFSEQLGSWCREHGVKYIGHLIEDDNHHTRTGSSLGHYFRGLAGQDMAGIDDIGGQVFPQGEDISYFHHIFDHRQGEFYHYLLGKLADSAAAIEPRKQGRSMCEIFGNYGWSEGVRLEKYLVDHFLVRGINHFVPHAFSAKAYPDPDCPPHFYAHGHNPQYRHFGSLMAYANRVCELMSDGRHVAPVAVLYHAEGDWTGKYMTADKVGHKLVDHQMDFDVLPQDVFEHRSDYNTVISAGKLRVNTQTYQAFVVPYSQYITAPLAEAIAEMTAAGIPVFYVGGKPEGLCKGSGAVPDANSVSLEELVPALEGLQIPEIHLQSANNRLRYRHYIHTDGTEIFFFVNEGTAAYTGAVTLPDPAGKTAYRYDAWNNRLAQVSLEGNELLLTVEPLHSFLLVLDPAASELSLPSPAAGKKQTLSFSTPWVRDICRSIEYPSFREETAVTLPDRLAEEAPEFSGFVRYRSSFRASDADSILLEISDAHEGVEVFLNSRSLGIQVAPPFRYDLTGSLVTGENRLSIEVATTLERENSNIPGMMGQLKKPTSHSGITGEVRLWTVK